MKLLINTSTTYKGGSVQVAVSFIHECMSFADNRYHIILSDSVSALLEEKAFPSNFIFYHSPYRPATKVLSFTNQASFLQKVEGEVKPDVVFTTSGPAYWRPAAPHVMGFNLAHYLYFDSPYFSLISFHDRWRWRLKGIFIKYYFRRDADAYVTQTDVINRRFRKWSKKKRVYTVSNTYGSQYENPKLANSKFPSLGLPGEVKLLVLSAYYRHKNLEILGEIVDLLQKEDSLRIRFVVTLPHKIYQSLYSRDQQKQISNIGPIKPSECPALYGKCDLVFIPTLLECFSAAYPEAMIMGKPIITTDLDFARSICANASLFYQPLSAQDALSKIKTLIEDPDLWNKLVSFGKERVKHFDSAAQRAMKYLETCENLISE